MSGEFISSGSHFGIADNTLDISNVSASSGKILSVGQIQVQSTETLNLSNLSTVHIKGEPTLAGSLTADNLYALHIESGKSKLGGELTVPNLSVISNGITNVFQNDGISSRLGTTSAHPLVLSGFNQESVILDDGFTFIKDNLVIGTENPDIFSALFLRHTDGRGIIIGVNTLANEGGSTFLWNGDHDIRIGTSQVERMRIKADGKIGINKSNPLYLLDVNGDLNFSGTLYQNGQAFVASNWSKTGSDIYYNTGNVGVGTTTPFAKLDVFNTASTLTSSRALTTVEFRGSRTSDLPESVLRLGRGHYAGVNWASSSEFQVYRGFDNGLNASSALKIRLGAGETDNPDTDIMTLFANGNVGVGTTNPLYRFDVNGDLNFSGTLYQNGVPFQSGSSQWTAAGLDIYYDSGNVGIKNTTPLYDLDVSGDINLTGSLFINGSPVSSTQPRPTFYVKKDNGTASDTSGTVVYNLVSENVGSGYSNTTGIFTAPLTGRYFISVNLLGAESSSYFFLLKNGSVYARSYESGTLSNSSLTCIVSLISGDQLKVEAQSTYVGTDSHCTFSGFYIHESGLGADLAVQPWNTNVSDIYYAAGNVGVGTTTPAFPLDVVGNARFANALGVSGITTITNNTSSVSTTTGALVVSGGSGIGGALNIGGSLGVSGASTLGTVSAGNTIITGTLGVSGITTITNNTSSVSTTTGALVIAGGLGVAENVSVGGTVRTANISSSAGTVAIAGLTATERLRYNNRINDRGTVLNNSSINGSPVATTSQALMKRSRTSYANTNNAVSLWTGRTSSDEGSAWRSICWSAELSLFVTVSSSNSRVMTSTDGINWINRTAPSNFWTSVCWSSELSLFVAVARAGTNIVMTSSDGITWLPKTTSFDTSEWTSVCWSPELSLFVAVARGGSTVVMTSSDGNTWLGRSANNSGWTSVCWSGELSLFVAVAFSGAVITSSDGDLWIDGTIFLNTTWSSVCWSPELSLFVAVANESGENGTNNKVMTSSNGFVWTARSSTDNNNWWNSVCWSPELSLFVAVAELGTSRIMTSTNGVNWVSRTASASNSWSSICWSTELSIFASVAFSGSGRVMTSRIGIPNSRSTLLASPAHASFNNNGNLSLTSNTQSTSTTTGALVVSGGVGISGNFSMGGRMRMAFTENSATGNITLTETTPVIRLTGLGNVNLVGIRAGTNGEIVTVVRTAGTVSAGTLTVNHIGGSVPGEQIITSNDGTTLTYTQRASISFIYFDSFWYVLSRS